MDLQTYTWILAFTFSAAINVSVAAYFFIFVIANSIVGKCLKPERRLAKIHKKSPNFMHCFYFDTTMYPCVIVCAIVMLFTSFPIKSPFTGDIPSEVIHFFTIACGIRVFLLCRDFLLYKNTKTKVIQQVVHIVYIIIVGNAILTEMAGIMAVIVIICEGDIIVVNIGKLLRHMGYKNSPCYRGIMFLGCYVTISFRAIIPLGLLAVSLVKGKPFNMDKASMIIFFVGLLIYGIVNTWHVNMSIARICKRKTRVVEVPYANFVQEVDDSLKQGEDEIPPCYEDACQPDLAVISSPGMATNGGFDDAEAGLCDQRDIETFTSMAHDIDLATIILRDSDGPYQPNTCAISDA